MLDAIHAMYAYSDWGNARILETASRLETSQLVAPWEKGESVRDILAHTASAQWTWLERWRGRSPQPPWDPREIPDLPTLRDRWATVEAETHQYVSALSEDDLLRDLSYVNFRGEARSYPLWRQLLHQANHATQHRSEAALLLTRLGHSPGNLDLLVYYDQLASQG